MPVIRPSGRGGPIASLRNHLADLLAKELMGERSRRGPVVFEIPTEPDKIDVIVVWEAWRQVPKPDRSAVIRDAYARYASNLEAGIHYLDPTKVPSDPLVPVVTLAIGATWDEVDELNLLPYSVQAQVNPDEIDPDSVRLLMIEAGAIETSQGVQLRFPDELMASDAHAKLVTEMPEAHWAIVKSVGSIDDLS